MNIACKFIQILKMICLSLIDGKRVVVELNTIQKTNEQSNHYIDIIENIS